ncbi:MAG: hypothetical protein V1875_09410 [Candidatus Altiarchaeota archaeon]
MKAYMLIPLIVLLSGCTLTPCDEPMKTIKGECCLDANGNGVCDSRENIGRIECQLPYIPYQGDCCLDANGNRICDSLETRIETTTTLQTYFEESTTTSTTLPENQTQETTTTAVRPRVTSSTTTTVPQVVPGVCYDSDGENPDVAGVTVGEQSHPPHTGVSKRDVCRNNQTVREYYCEGRYLHEESLLCQSWQVCMLDRCCLPKGSQCRSPRDCCSGECARKLYFSLCT